MRGLEHLCNPRCCTGSHTVRLLDQPLPTTRLITLTLLFIKGVVSNHPCAHWFPIYVAPTCGASPVFTVCPTEPYNHKIGESLNCMVISIDRNFTDATVFFVVRISVLRMLPTE